MNDRRLALSVSGVAVAFALVASAYNTFLHAPAAVAARPELADLGFWTALFSGRFTAWLFYHEPIAGTALTLAMAGLFAGVVIWLS